MSKKLRYILLSLCILVFLGLAPVLVFFVRGVSFDSSGTKLQATGIIAIETNPGDAEVFLNGELKSTTPASVRFLKTGDYNIRLRKPGYFDWQKKLSVIEGKVTWANPNPNKITLLKSSLEPRVITKGAELFSHLPGGKLAYISGNSVIVLSGKEFSETHTLSLSTKPLSLLPSPGGKYLYVETEQKTYIVNLESFALTDISTVVRPKSAVTFISDNELFVAQTGILTRVSLDTLAAQTLFSNIQTFAVADDRIYVLQREKNISTLLTAPINSPFDTQTILNGLPIFVDSKIFVTLQRQVLLFGDKTLYRINTTLEEIASNIGHISFDQPSSSLVFTVPGELDYYNFDENKIKLISRSNEPFTNIILRRDLNYAFYIHTNTLIAIELDDRDRQNIYSLLALQNNGNFTFTQDGDAILALENGIISLLTIK